MGIFKRINTLEGNIACMAMRIAELEKRIETIEKENEELKAKLPEYEEAVARGVEEVLDKAMRDVADYNPYRYLNFAGGK